MRWKEPPSGSPEARIPAGSHVKYYRTARSAFSAVLPDLAGPWRESGKNVLEWRDLRARGRLLCAEGPGGPTSLRFWKAMSSGLAASYRKAKRSRVIGEDLPSAWRVGGLFETHSDAGIRVFHSFVRSSPFSSAKRTMSRRLWRLSLDLARVM